MRTTCLDAYQHQELSFDRLLAQLKPGRLVNRNPYFQVNFDIVNLPPEEPEVPGLSVTNVILNQPIARYEFTVGARETAEGISLQITYSRDLFSCARVREILEQYKYLLEQVVENPDRRIEDYSLVTAAARRLLPDPTVPLDDRWYGAVHEAMADFARTHPDKLAVQDPHEKWTYKELNERSNQLAHCLRENGVAPGDTVS